VVARIQRCLRVDHRWPIVVGVVVVAFFGSGTSWYAMGIFFSPLMEEFGWGRGAYSIAISLYLTLLTASAVPVGRLVDRWGPRRVMLTSAVASGLIWGLVSQIGQVERELALWQLYLSYGLLAAASAGVGSVPASTVIARWFTTGRGLAMGMAIVGFGLPGVVLVPLSAPFIAAYGWRALALALGALCWLGPIPFIIGVLRDTPPVQEQSQKAAGAHGFAGIAAGAALHMAPFWIIGVCYLLAQFGSVAVQMHAIPFLMDGGLSRELASNIWGFLALAGTVGKIGLGHAADRFSSKVVLLASLLLQVVALIMTLTWPGLTTAWLFALLFGLGMGGQFASRPLLVGEYFGLRAFGTIAGAVWLFTLPGIAGGQPVAGFLYDFTGSYRLAYSLFIVTFLLATSVLLFLRRSPGRS
jgi:MFS family permease